MRLLTLQFSNVNSLAGNWEIDFTAPEYRRSPLFAITGKTGSGKSSILDAISLALYGCTPRVHASGSKAGLSDELRPDAKDEYDENCPLLTKGAAIIRAAVRFEAGNTVYMSSWQRRIKRTGKLSEAEVELVRYESPEDTEGTVVATKIRDWEKEILNITKMSFEIFTRSVLLAQGAFSNFLKASDNERSQILERITGTGIYSDISIKVHERSRTEKNKLELLKGKAEACEVLSDENRREKERILADAGLALGKAEKDVRRLDEALRWRRRVDTLTETLCKKESLLREALEKDRNFNALREKARLAAKAEEIYAIYCAAKDAGQNLLDLRNEMKENSANTETLLKVIPQKRSLVRDASQKENRAKEAVLAFKGPFKEMIEADLRIETLHQRVNTALSEKEHCGRSLAESKKELAAIGEAYDEAKLSLEQIDKINDENAFADIVIGELPALRTESTTLGRCRKEVAEAEKSLSLIVNTLDALTQKEKNAKNALETARVRKAERKLELEEIQRLLDTARAGDSPAGIPEAIMTITRRQYLIGEYVFLSQAEKELSETLEALSRSSEENGCSAWWNRTAMPRLEKSRLTTRLRLKEITNTYPEVAAHLIKGENHLLEQLEKERQAVITHTIESARLLSERDKALEALNKSENEYKQAVFDLERLKGQIKASHEKSELLEAGKTALEKTAETSRETFEKLLARIPDEYRKENPDDQLAALEECALQRKSCLEKADKTQKRVTELKESLLQLQPAVTLIEKEYKERAAAFDRDNTVLSELRKMRLERFGDTDPRAEEKRLSSLLQSAQSDTERKKEALRRSETDLQLLKSKADLLSAQEKKVSEQLRSLEDSVSRKVEEEEFQSIETVLAVRMPVRQIRDIEEKSRLLRESLLALRGETAQAKESLTNELERALSSESPEKLEEELSQARSSLNESLRLSERIRSELDSDDRHREQSSAIAEEIRLQRETADKWGRLKELIGSSDGKKFRTAAQKITFRILLKYANQAISAMTSRYSLFASGPEGLSVDVLDKDMGAQLRTSRNLSGGESFIVSLALALGLSRMGGRNLRVDTLFLDEGFGTLDEHTLDSALYALENLQETSGKLIGVISHVKSVRDRIETHITVTAKPGSGKSTLKGPGVRKLD